MAHVEDGCLGCVRRVLQAEGWPARSWQQDGLLVEDEGGRRLSPAARRRRRRRGEGEAGGRDAQG